MMLEDLQTELGLEFFGYQYSAIYDSWELDDELSGEYLRTCLYFRTGAGKSYTALGMLRIRGYETAVVIAPPSTHPAWIEAGVKFGVKVQPMSHARFRGKRTVLKRDVPVIADEFHLFGGERGQGFKKLDRLSGGLKAPLILASATPNYNDAERVYCIQHVLDPLSCRGGLLEFLYTHCNTQQNPFGAYPLVDSAAPFKSFKDAAHYLSSLKGVFYLPDNLTYDIEELTFLPPSLAYLDTFGYNARNHKMVASIIEERHTRVAQTYINGEGNLSVDPWLTLKKLMPGSKVGRPGPIIVFCNHATIAEATMKRLLQQGYEPAGVAIITGKTAEVVKNQVLQDFRDGKISVLVGTASLATGTDGLDKVCDTMVIMDDTDDDALRRQLIGRIMPRGTASDASRKKVYRISPLS